MSDRKPGYKEGANNSDQVRIRALSGAGRSPEEISDALRIHLPIVQNFLPEVVEKARRKRRTKAEMEAAKAAEEPAQEAEE